MESHVETVPTQSSFLTLLISNSARFARVPSLESPHLGVEKLLLLLDAMESIEFNGQIDISESEKIDKIIRFS